MRRAAAIILCGFLASCASAPDVQVGCPALKTWTADQQKALAAALEPIPESSPIWQMEFDWGRMRGEIRACKATNH